MIPKGLNVALVMLILLANCRDFYYTNNQLSEQFYRCYKEQGFDRIGLLVDVRATGIDQESVRNIQYAKSAGLIVDGVYGACRSRRSAEEEVNLMLKSLGSNLIDRFWLYPETATDDICSWGQYSGQSNCQYFQKLIQLVRTKMGVPVDVAIDLDIWVSSFKSALSCPEASTNTKLWYVPEDLDGKPDFSDYVKRGGWQTPFMKMYDSRVICREQLLINYYI